MCVMMQAQRAMLTSNRNLKEKLMRESAEFVRQQRIQCLLQGAWFINGVPPAQTGTLKRLNAPWRFMRLVGSHPLFTLLHVYVEAFRIMATSICTTWIVPPSSKFGADWRIFRIALRLPPSAKLRPAHVLHFQVPCITMSICLLPILHRRSPFPC